MGLDLNDLNVDLHKLGTPGTPKNHQKLVFGASFPEISHQPIHLSSTFW